MSNEIITTPKCRRGGQPGNLNALKHGYYSRHFSKMELKDLDAMLENGLDSEIRMLRVSIRRLFELTQENEDVEIGLRLLTVLGNTASRLANLLRTEALLGGNRELSIYNQLVMAIEVVAKERMGDE
jgi:hypothetical protein